TWASGSGHFNDENIAFLGDGTAISTDDEGDWLVTTPEGETRAEAAEDYDPETGELTVGYSYISADGVAFDLFSEAFNKISPENVSISDDGLSVTVTYDTFYVDYPFATLSPGVPAHIVAGRALGIDDAAAAKQALIDAF